MSFDLHRHPEEFEDSFLAEQEFQDYFVKTLEKLEKAFTNDIKELICYGQITSSNEYQSAVQEAYEQADDEMRCYMSTFGILSLSDFIIYLNGVEKGMGIRHE
jgi:fibronectin type 3 domain-containing protein